MGEAIKPILICDSLAAFEPIGMTSKFIPVVGNKLATLEIDRNFPADCIHGWISVGSLVQYIYTCWNPRMQSLGLGRFKCPLIHTRSDRPTFKLRSPVSKS